MFIAICEGCGHLIMNKSHNLLYRQVSIVLRIRVYFFTVCLQPKHLFSIDTRNSIKLSSAMFENVDITYSLQLIICTYK